MTACHVHREQVRAVHESLCSKFSDETEVSLDRVYWERKVADQARAKELPQRRAALLEGLATHRNAPLSQLQSLRQMARALQPRLEAEADTEALQAVRELDCLVQQRERVHRVQTQVESVRRRWRERCSTLKMARPLDADRRTLAAAELEVAAMLSGKLPPTAAAGLDPRVEGLEPYEQEE